MTFLLLSLPSSRYLPQYVIHKGAYAHMSALTLAQVGLGMGRFVHFFSFFLVLLVWFGARQGMLILRPPRFAHCFSIWVNRLNPCTVNIVGWCNVQCPVPARFLQAVCCGTRMYMATTVLRCGEHRIAIAITFGASWHIAHHLGLAFGKGMDERGCGYAAIVATPNSINSM